MDEVIGPIIGMAGVVLGIALNEFLSRSRRAEKYSSAIFEKRLSAYEELMRLIQIGNEVFYEVTETPKLTKEERHDLISRVILPIAHHVDKNTLYINEELGAHCVALFMGAEDIYDAVEKDKEEALSDFYKMRTDTYRMISEDSGVEKITKLFHSINRPKITSPTIERIRELRRLNRGRN